MTAGQDGRREWTFGLGATAGAALLLSLGAGLAAPSSAQAQAGSYQGSCRSSTTSGGRLFSECRMPDGQYRRSSIETGRCHGDIGNQNGLLACNGAVAQDGGIVAVAPSGRNDGSAGRGRDGRGDDGRRVNDRTYGDRDDRGYGDRGHGDDRTGYGRRPSDLVLYEGVNYSGRAFEVHGDVSDLKRSGFNDRAHSAKVYSGRWKLCRESDYRRCEHIRSDVPDLNRLGAGGSVSSVERE